MVKFGNTKRIIILIFLMLFLSLNLFVLFNQTKMRHEIHYGSYYDLVADSQLETLSVDDDVGESNENILVSLRSSYGNDDIIGKLVIDGTNIDEPILQYANNSYYLYHDVYKNNSVYGSTYLDYRNKLDDKKILIFGHSAMNKDVPFNELEKYYDKSFYDYHKYIDIVSDNGKMRYLIFSVFVETMDFTYMNLNISDDTYNSYLAKYKNKSMYDTGVDVSNGDEILILQTCSNSPVYKQYKKKYLLVIAKKINKEEWK